MKNELWKISRLSNWKKNPRDITKKDLERLKSQIKKLGQYKPLIVNTNPKVAPIGSVAGGNMRLRAMISLGVKEVWVIPRRFKTEDEMIEISLSDNDRAGHYDEEELVSLITGKNIELSDFSLDLRIAPSLSDIASNYSKPNTEDDQAPELPKKAKARAGDIYQLGRHRVLCGDATKEECYKSLLRGKLANLVFTDPPYNVDYKSPAGARADGKILNDKMMADKYLGFLQKVAKNVYEFSTPTMSIYWWFASRNIEANLKALRDSRFFVSQWILWVKNSLVLSRQDYHRCFEPCLVGWKQGGKHFSNKNKMNFKDVFTDAKNNDEALKGWLSQVFVEEFDIWFQHRDATKKYLHPTQKPVALAERAIKKNSKPGDLVLDVFGGSGSTLIAAEKLGRVAYLMDLDPMYVDVIVKRWEQFTDGKARKI